MELLHTGQEALDIVDVPDSCDLLHNWPWSPKEGMMWPSCGVAEICQAFEDLVELEKEGVCGEAVHLGTAPAPLFDVLPAVEDPLLHLVVDHGGDVGVLVVEDVPQGLHEGLGASLPEEDLEDPFN